MKPDEAKAKASFENQWFPVFRAGTHTDSKGREVVKTKADLDTIIANFEKADEKPPLVIGHPRFDAPRYGTISELKRKGKVLYAKATDVYEKFAKAVADNLFPKRSIAIKENSLKHLGFGGYYPAVQGMPDLEFSLFAVESEDEEISVVNLGEHTFSEETIVKKIVNGIKNYFGEESMTEKEQEKSTDTDNQETDNQELQTLKDENAALKKDKSELVNRISSLEEKDKNREQKEKEKEVSDFCDSLIAQGKITPAEKEEHFSILNALKGDAEHNFSEGDDKSKAPFATYKKKLADRPVNFVLNQKDIAEGKTGNQAVDVEQYGDNVDENDLELFEAAQEIAEKEKITFDEALEKATKGGR